jgi:tRNA nucleotidyltransferase/poly(A) polymerase
MDLPVAMEIDTSAFKALFSSEMKILASLFKECGNELRIEGGAVRDLLMKLQQKDLDFATTATPDIVE